MESLEIPNPETCSPQAKTGPDRVRPQASHQALHASRMASSLVHLFRSAQNRLTLRKNYSHKESILRIEKSHSPQGQSTHVCQTLPSLQDVALSHHASNERSQGQIYAEAN